RARVPVGWLRRHLFLGRSQGRDRRCLHDTGAEPDTRVLSQDVQVARLSGTRGLKSSPYPRRILNSEAAASRCLAIQYLSRCEPGFDPRRDGIWLARGLRAAIAPRPADKV